jgi:cellulase/cellobiase CelA1
MAAVTVTNAGTVPVTWSVTIVYGDAGISNGWYAVFAQTGSSTWVVTPPPWQPTLPPGASATFGVIGTGDGIPQSIEVTCLPA